YCWRIRIGPLETPDSPPPDASSRLASGQRTPGGNSSTVSLPFPVDSGDGAPEAIFPAASRSEARSRNQRLHAAMERLPSCPVSCYIRQRIVSEVPAARPRSRERPWRHLGYNALN